jgi:hypothetical protein
MILCATGCATVSLPEPSYDRFDHGTISIDTYTETPKVEIDSRLEGNLGSATAGGAVAGAGETILGCLEVPYPPLLLVCGLAGATVGGLTSAIKGIADATEQESIAKLVNTIYDGGVQKYISQEALLYAGSQDLIIAKDGGERDATVMIYLKKVKIYMHEQGRGHLPGIIKMTFSGQLVKDGKVVDQYDIERSAGWDDISELNTENIGSLISELDYIIKNTAQQYIDEFILIYHPRASQVHKYAPKDKTFPKSVPAYVLRPINPPASSKFKAPAEVDYPDVDTLRIKFQWEPFPREWDMTEVDFRGITDIVYDFRLFSEDKVMIYEKSGLQEPSYSIEMELSPCTKYSWTMRARFKLRGMPKVTEWSGAYNKNSPASVYSPAVLRRGGPVLFNWYYVEDFSFGFKTPANAPETECIE